MPDKEKKTISATQVSALFNASQYCTKWMLWQHFKNGVDIDSPEDSRMSWGRRLQPLLLEQAAQDLNVVVEPNPDLYVRNGLLGATRDGRIFDPSRGWGAIETKCVFAYDIWMSKWDGGKNPPRDHEIQVQTQMLVGDGEGTEPYKWGVIAAWVCGEMKYFPREPVPEFWDSAKDEAARFFDDVKNDREPDPAGASVETRLLDRCFPLKRGEVLDLSREDLLDDKENALQWMEQARMFAWHREQRLGHERGEETLKARLKALAKGHEEVRLPHGVKVGLRQQGKGVALNVYVPENVEDGALEF